MGVNISSHVSAGRGWHGGSTDREGGRSPGNQSDPELRMNLTMCFVNLGKFCHTVKRG